MFRRSEIGPKCACDAPETVCKEYGFKRYLVPKGYYGGLYQSASYYVAEWILLRCEVCKNQRNDFFVFQWSPSGDFHLVDSPMHPEGKPRKYPDVKQAILEQMDTIKAVKHV